MAESMIHWNGCQMIAIAIHTTGKSPNIHEIFHLSAIALDSNSKPRTDVLPFTMDIMPDNHGYYS